MYGAGCRRCGSRWPVRATCNRACPASRRRRPAQSRIPRRYRFSQMLRTPEPRSRIFTVPAGCARQCIAPSRLLGLMSRWMRPFSWRAGVPARLPDVIAGRADGQRAAVLDEPLQVHALDELHHHTVRSHWSASWARTMFGCADLAGGLDLAVEAGDGFLVGDLFLADHFDGDDTLMRRCLALKTWPTPPSPSSSRISTGRGSTPRPEPCKICDAW